MAALCPIFVKGKFHTEILLYTIKATQRNSMFSSISSLYLSNNFQTHKSATGLNCLLKKLIKQFAPFHFSKTAQLWKCICPNCKMYLFKVQNIFVKKNGWWINQIACQRNWIRICPLWLSLKTAKLYRCICLNLKCMCSNCAKYICQKKRDCWIKLSAKDVN